VRERGGELRSCRGCTASGAAQNGQVYHGSLSTLPYGNVLEHSSTRTMARRGCGNAAYARDHVQVHTRSLAPAHRGGHETHAGAVHAYVYTPQCELRRQGSNNWSRIIMCS
jgi:hypothetical protein